MSNKQKLKKQPLPSGTPGAYTNWEPFGDWPPKPFEDLEDRVWHAVQALSVAGQKTVQCKFCRGPNPIKLETLLDDDHAVGIGIVWRICPDHGLEAICRSCAIYRRPQMHRPEENS